ncbi:TRAP transporter small permease [Ammoniphilus sp. YIM 78166]|uniref:TRAP transporter small permease n=1 Tax=Ammoniphilus sp. YIM 78166 TaxID=1644106 RepID=UPI0010706740|nr:TRAP transporter small permease [Ammoniphilus sp. YIM 78166]
MKKWMERMESFQISVACLFLVTFVLCVILQVLSRYVPFIEIDWTEEAAKYSFIWAMFMGAAIMVRRKGHFAMSFVIDLLPARLTRGIHIFNHVLIFSFGLLMVYYGYLLTVNFWDWSLNTMPFLKQRYIWAVIPVSGASMALYSLGAIFELVCSSQNEAQEEKKGVSRELEAR